MEYNDFHNKLEEDLIKYDIPYDKKTIKEDSKKLYEYMIYILKTNEYINLTAIKDSETFFKKHIIDSLYILKYIDEILGDEKDSSKSFLDIGTGGGFPIVPIYIMKNYNSFGLDSVLKKLKVIADKEDINIIHGRAEILAHDEKYREKFDLVTSRALSSLKNVIEYSSGFVKSGKYAILMRGKKEKIDKEMQEVIKKCSFGLIKQEEYELYGESRSVVILKKVNKLNKNLPNKNSKHYKSKVVK